MSANHRPPAIQFYWKDWLTDDAVQSMTYDEQGRYVRVLAMTYLSSTPGVCTEADVQRWTEYPDAEWAVHREAIRRAFKLRPDGVWIQKRTVEEREAQRQRHEQAEKGGRASARRARDARGQFVAGLDAGLDVQLDRGAGTPPSAPASDSSERNQTNPSTAPVLAKRGPSNPRGAANEPRGLEPVGEVLAHALSPRPARVPNRSAKDLSDDFLDAQQAKFLGIDVRVIAAHVREEMASGGVRDPRGLLVHRCKEAMGQATARASTVARG